jgi:hypothetical protein
MEFKAHVVEISELDDGLNSDCFISRYNLFADFYIKVPDLAHPAT